MKQKLLLTITLWLTLLGSAWAQSNNALHFSYATKNRVDIGAFAESSPDFSQGFSFAGWVKFDQFKDLARVFTFAPSQSVGSNNLMLSASGTTGLIMAEVNVAKVTTTTPLQTNKWYFLTLTVTSGGVATIYVDGIAAASETLAAPENNARNTCYLGNSSYDEARGLNGSLDEVSIWSRALSAAEIGGIMNGISSPTSQTGLLAYYTFNQGTAGGINTSVTTLTDVTTNAKNGTLKDYTLSGTTSNWVAGYTSPTTNNALHFDGIDDHVSCATTNPTQFTVEAWAYPTVLGKDQALISTLYTYTKVGMELHIGDDNIPIITICNSDFVDVKGTTAVKLNEWVHLAASYDGSTVKLYMNGTEVNSASFSGYQNGTGAFTLGRRFFTDQYHFTGRIDEVRSWDVARTQTDIAATMNTSLAGTETDLQAYYNFNQGTAGGDNTTITTLTDATANHKNGTLEDFALTGTSSNWVEGYMPNCTLAATPNEIYIERTSGSTATFNIMSNTTWSTIDADDWLDLDVTSGTGSSIINLTTNETNTTGAIRSIQLVISGYNVDDVTVTVIQKTENISVSQNQLAIGAGLGSATTFDIAANVEWTITGLPDWLSLSQQTGTGNATITVTALTANATETERLGTLIITGVGVAMPINVAIAQSPQLAVNITKTDASVIAGTGISLQEAIGTTPLAEVQKLEITAGSFASTDWQWIFNNRGNLSNLTHFTITDGITLVADIPSKVFNGGIKFISIAKAENIGVHAFYNLKNLKSVEFPDVKNISLGAFVLCDSLSFVNLPKALTIGQQAFSSCKSLTSMYLPELTDLGSTAFQGCIMLSTIRLPKVTSISSNYPFIECSVLTNIMLGATPPAAAETSFASSSDTRYLTPIDEARNPLTGAELAGAIEQYRNVDDGNTSDNNWYGSKLGETLFTVTVDPAITHGKVSVGEYQAAGATVPIGVTPDAQHTVTEVWYTTQSGAVQAITGNTFTMPAENITLSATFVPNVLKVLVNGTIEKTGSSLVNALTGITYKNITSLTIYGGHFTLADWQWMQSYKAYFTGLTHFTITNDISSVAHPIGISPFGNQIKEVSIAKLTRIYHGFLSGNTGITHANFPHVNATELSGATFANCTALTSINCPLIHLLVNSEFANCTSLTTAILPGLTRIGASSNKQAFKNCTSLTHLVLGTNPPIGARYEFAESPATRYITIANAQGEELANAYAAYRAVPDGNTTDNYWYGWQIEGGMERYTLAPSPTITNGQVNLSVWGLLPEGLNSELTIQPAEGYKLTEGSLRAYNSNDEGVSVAIEKNICGILSLTSQAFDVTVTAQFEGLPQELTVLPAVNGTFSVTPTENIVTGTPITISAVQPAMGYKLKEGFPRAYKTDSPETPVALTDNTDGTLSFSMAPYAVTVTVEFELQPYTVSVDANIVNGTLAATPSENVTMGTEVTLTITPDAGYKLTENSLRAYKTDDESVVVEIADGKFTMPAFDVTVTAEFEALPQVLTLETVANGTITATPSEGIVTDTEITLSTTPANGYKLVENSLRAYKTGDETVIVTIVDNKFTMPAFDVTVTAEFEMPVATYNVMITDLENGSVTVTPSTNVTEGTEIALAIATAEQYQLVANSLRAYKTGDETVTVTIVDNKFTMPAFDVTVTAEFEVIPAATYNVMITDLENGSVTATPSENVTEGTEIALAVTPNTNYQLVANSLRAYKTGDETVTVTIVDNKFAMPAFDVTVTAEFEVIPAATYNVIISDLENGSVTATPSTNVTEGTEIALAVTADENHQLVANSLRAYKTGDETVTVTIVDNKFAMPAFDVTVTAEFEVIPAATYNVTISEMENGSVTATPSENVTEGTEIALEVATAEQYQLVANSLRAYKTGDETVTVTIVDNKFAMPAFDVTVTAEFEPVTGVESALSTVLTVYPNPAGEQVFIKGLVGKTMVEVYSLVGEKVSVQWVNVGEPIDLSNISSGNYLLKIESQTLKLLVVK